MRSLERARLDPNLFVVEDGTGVIEIHYKLQQYMSTLEQRRQIDEKYRNQADNLRKTETKVVDHVPNKLPEPRPGFCYSSDTCLRDIAVRSKLDIDKQLDIDNS